MKPTLLVFTLIALFSLSNSSKLTDSVVSYIQNPGEKGTPSFIDKGKMDGCFTDDEFWDIYLRLRAMYPQHISGLERFGHSYKGRHMHGFYLGLNEHPTPENKNLNAEKNIILFTGLHHSRECLTLNMVLNIFTRKLKELVQKDGDTLKLFYNNRFFFIPVFNIDARAEICAAWGTPQWQRAKMIRKSRHVDSKFNCPKYTGGVDLNRNYGYKWGIDNEGSNPSPCTQDYRGTAPFSEPETRAMRSWVTENSPKNKEKSEKAGENTKHSKGSVVSGMNFHSYGDLWIQPYNYLKDGTDKKLEEEKKTHWLYNAYQEFNTKSYHPKGAKYGNAIKTINYLANGEAADWMLHEHSIFAFSPELGSSLAGANTFYPQRSIEKEIITEDFKVVESFIDMHQPKFVVTYERSTLAKKQFITGLPKNLSGKVEKSPISIKSAKSEYILKFFLDGLSDLRAVRFVFLFKGEAPKSLNYSTGRGKEQLKLSSLKVSHFTGGCITEPLVIHRRSKLNLHFSSNLGSTNEFVMLIEKNKQLIGRFVHVLSAEKIVDLLKSKVER